MNTTHGTPAGNHPADPSLGRAHRKRLFRWGTGITLAGFLAGGGIALAAVAGGPAAGTSSAGPASNGLSSNGALSNGQGAILNSALSTAAGSGSAATPARVRRALGRLRLFGVDGTITVHAKTGFRTLSFERGTIQSVRGSDVVIKAADGTTWTWQIVSDTVVRKDGAKTTASALAAGETVFAGGPVVSGGRDARLIVIRPAKSSGSSPSPGSSPSAGSGSTQSSLSRHQQLRQHAAARPGRRTRRVMLLASMRHNET